MAWPLPPSSWGGASRPPAPPPLRALFLLAALALPAAWACPEHTLGAPCIEGVCASGPGYAPPPPTGCTPSTAAAAAPPGPAPAAPATALLLGACLLLCSALPRVDMLFVRRSGSLRPGLRYPSEPRGPGLPAGLPSRAPSGAGRSAAKGGSALGAYLLCALLAVASCSGQASPAPNATAAPATGGAPPNATASVPPSPSPSPLMCAPNNFIAPGTRTCMPLCPAGYFSPRNASANESALIVTNISTALPGNGSCAPCPVGYFCPLNASSPTPCSGWALCTTLGMADSAGSCPLDHYCSGNSAQQCIGDGRCTLTGCKEGYTGYVCGACSTGFYSDSQQCLPCTTVYSRRTKELWAIVISAVVCGGFICFSIMVQCTVKSRGSSQFLSGVLRYITSKHAANLKSSAFFIQLSSLILLNATGIQFPLNVRPQLLNIASVASFNVESFRLDCTESGPLNVTQIWMIMAACYWAAEYNYFVWWNIFLPKMPVERATRARVRAQHSAFAYWYTPNSLRTFMLPFVFQQSLRCIAYMTVGGVKYLSFAPALVWWDGNQEHQVVVVSSILVFLGTLWQIRCLMDCNWEENDTFGVQLKTLLDAVEQVMQFTGSFALLYGPGNPKEASLFLVIANALQVCAFCFIWYMVRSAQRDELGLNTTQFSALKCDLWCYVGALLLNLATVLVGFLYSRQMLQTDQARRIASLAVVSVNYTYLAFLLYRWKVRFVLIYCCCGKEEDDSLPEPEPVAEPDEFHMNPLTPENLTRRGAE